MSDAATPRPDAPEPGSDEWARTPIYPQSYEVTEDGRVRSRDRWVKDRHGRWRHYRARTLTPWITTAGYPMVGLCGGRVGERRSVTVHSLVKGAFHGPTPPGMEIRHLDGDPLNCHLSNLEFGTSAQNKADIRRHGRNYWANRDRCDLGHPLEGANVAVYRSEGVERRRCVACARARSVIQYMRSKGEVGDLRTTADRKYAEIVAGTNSRHTTAAAITSCPQGHPLVVPNLVESNPGRMCKACSRTHGAKAYAKRKGYSFDFMAVAAAKYAEIMRGVPQEVVDSLMQPPVIPPVAMQPYERRRSTRLDPKEPRPGPTIPDLPGERWVPIPGREGHYEVSSLARVKSLDRYVPFVNQADRFIPGKLLKPLPNRNGYPIVGLPDRSAKSGSRTYLVHLLVTAAFLGPTPVGQVVLHGDGDPGNARLDNLRFDTHAVNQQEMVRHGNGPGDRAERARQGLIRDRGRRHGLTPPVG